MKNNQPGMTLITKTITRLTVGLILIYGIFIVLEGHIGPGGGFAGGLIIALSFIHLMLAFGKEAVLKKLNQPKSLILMGSAAVLFLFLVFLSFINIGIVNSTVPQKDFRLFSAGLIPFLDITYALLVGAGLFAVFLALVLVAKEERKE